MTETSTQTMTFEVGEHYEARSAADYDCIWRFEVVARTAKFITIADADTRETTRRVGVRVWEGVEKASPLGQYSLSPVLSADRKTVAR